MRSEPRGEHVLPSEPDSDRDVRAWVRGWRCDLQQASHLFLERPHLQQSPRAALTNDRKLGGLKQQKFTLPVREARSLKPRRRQGWLLPEVPGQGLFQAFFLAL